MKKHTIWSSTSIYDLVDDLHEEYPDAKGADLYRMADEINSEYLDDERANLKQELDDTIIIIADLGLWFGRRTGYRLLNTHNLGDCLSCIFDTEGEVTWYIDERKDLCCKASHHDGTNYYTYREWKPGTSDASRQNLINKVYNGTATRRDITRVTRRLGDRVCSVYGW